MELEEINNLLNNLHTENATPETVETLSKLQSGLSELSAEKETLLSEKSALQEECTKWKNLNNELFLKALPITKEVSTNEVEVAKKLTFEDFTKNLD